MEINDVMIDAYAARVHMSAELEQNMFVQRRNPNLSLIELSSLSLDQVN